MEAPLSSPLFWGSLLTALVLAGLAALPVNYWLIARGKGHAVVHAHHGHGGAQGGREQAVASEHDGHGVVPGRREHAVAPEHHGHGVVPGRREHAVASEHHGQAGASHPPRPAV